MENLRSQISKSSLAELLPASRSHPHRLYSNFCTSLLNWSHLVALRNHIQYLLDGVIRFIDICHTKELLEYLARILTIQEDLNFCNRLC